MMSQLLFHVERLKQFTFTVDNPAFWLGCGALFVILLRFWNIRKSLYFCLTIAGLLLLMTYTETLFRNALLRHGEGFDPFFLRLIAAFFLAIVLVYYILVKQEE